MMLHSTAQTLDKRPTNLNVSAFTKSSHNKSTHNFTDIGRHFSNFFQPVIANTSKLVDVSTNIRHQVFCDELELFEKTVTKTESDDFDSFSTHCLIQHKKTSNFCGTVRLILPNNESDILPIRKIAQNHITNMKLHPANFSPDETIEISRIAIPKIFRKRSIDQFQGAAVAGIDLKHYSEIELRCFPFIAIGLYLSCASLGRSLGRKHNFFMVEPRLARSMRVIGIKLQQIGNEFEYVGTRAPYYINYDEFSTNLKPSFKYMMNEFIKKIG